MQRARFAFGLSVLSLASCILVSCSSGGTDAVTVTVTSTGAATAAPISSGPAIPASASTPTTAKTPTSRTGTTTSPPTTSRTGTRSSATAPAPGSCAQAALDSLTPAQRIGQLLMVGVAADDPAASMPKLPVGGVFLSGRSTSSADAVLAGVKAIQKSVTRTSGVPAQVAVDQEGGYVQSLRGPDFPAIPTALEQGRLDAAELHDATVRWAKGLVQAGITLDLAPVADVVPAGTEQQNPPIGGQDRQYGSTPQSVGDSVVAVVDGMLDAKLGSTVKHFPGLGRVTENTDTSANAVDDQTTADDVALQPFRAAISARTTAVMISSATYPQLDPDHPAVFSTKIITGLLRTRMHFGALVISDDLGSAVAVQATPVGQRAVDFVTAGGDLVLTVQPTDLVPMTAALTSAAARSVTFRARVDDAALHVLQSKQSLGLLPCIRAGVPGS
jgi:beta-N-acetylhexosaminidase